LIYDKLKLSATDVEKHESATITLNLKCYISPGSARGTKTDRHKSTVLGKKKKSMINSLEISNSFYEISHSVSEFQLHR